MERRFAIRFAHGGFCYQADIQAFDLEGTVAFAVEYWLNQFPYPIRKLEIFAGSGVDVVTYWRQRIPNKDDELLPAGFIRAIGFAIEMVER
jgi:hypothetical protein